MAKRPDLAPPDVVCKCGHLGQAHEHAGWLPSLDCLGCAKERPAFSDGRIHIFEAAGGGDSDGD